MTPDDKKDKDELDMSDLDKVAGGTDFTVKSDDYGAGSRQLAQF